MIRLTLPVDRAAQEPIYHQIKRHLASQIEHRVLEPGDRLPPTRDLADQLGVARISVVAAYEELKAEGLISTHVGRGTFVAAQDGEPDLSSSSSASIAGVSRAPGTALRDLLRLAARPGVIDFSQGTPAEDFLPVDLIRKAINHVLQRDGAAAVTYESPEGYQPLREEIARRLTTQGISAQAGDILITGGC